MKFVLSHMCFVLFVVDWFSPALVIVRLIG